MCILCDVLASMPEHRALNGIHLVQSNHVVNLGLITYNQAKKILINHKYQPIEADAILKYWIEQP